MDTLAQRIKAKYPGQYDDIPDVELESRVKAKYPGVYDDIPTTQKQESPSVMSQVGHQIGLTARAGLTGNAITGLATMGGDVIGHILNLGIRAYNSQTGSNIPEFPPQGQALEQNLTAAGMPEPQNAAERVVYDVNRAAAGAGTGAAVAGAMAPTSTIGQGVASTLASNPGTQITAATGGAAASGVTRELGGGPLAQTAAGVAGSIAAPAAIEAGKAGVRTVGALVRPFTEGGREQIVGNALSGVSTDAARAKANLAQPEEIVPGSQPTTAQVAQDPGLATVERAVRSKLPAGGRFSEQFSKNNEARTILLDSIAKDRAALDSAVKERAQVVGPLYDQAFKDFQGVPPALQPKVVDIIGRLSSTKALSEAQKLATMNGINMADPSQSLQGLHYVKLAIDDMLEHPATNGLGSTQQRALVNIKNDLVDSMQKMSPMYELAQGAWAQASKPIEQMKTLQDISQRVQNAGIDQTGNRIMSQAKWFNVVGKNREELSKVLSPDQMRSLASIGRDLDRGAFVESAGKASGSNTFQNLSTANVLGAMLGGQVNSTPAWIQTLTRPLGFIYKIPNDQMEELMTDAMLDPKVARALMSKASAKSLGMVGRELASRARAAGIGLATQQSQQAQGNQQ